MLTCVNNLLYGGKYTIWPNVCGSPNSPWLFHNHRRQYLSHRLNDLLPFKFFHTKVGKPFISGPRFEHRVIIVSKLLEAQHCHKYHGTLQHRVSPYLDIRGLYQTIKTVPDQKYTKYCTTCRQCRPHCGHWAYCENKLLSCTNPQLWHVLTQVNKIMWCL